MGLRGGVLGVWDCGVVCWGYGTAGWCAGGMGLRGGVLGVWDCGEVCWGYGTAGRWTGGKGSGEEAVRKVCRVGYWDSGWDVLWGNVCWEWDWGKGTLEGECGEKDG